MGKFLQNEISVVNAKWFGAVGDGITDDTDALERAVVAARGRILFIPEGKYILHRALGIHADFPTIIQGEGQNVYNDTARKGTVLSWVEGVYGFYCVNPGNAVEALHQVVIKDIALFGNGIASDGIYATYFHNLHIINVWISGFAGHGIYWTACWGSKIHNTISTHNKLNGCFLTQSCNSITISNCIFNANAAQEGYANLFISANETLENLRINVIGCDFSYAGASADGTPTENYNVVIINTWGVNFIGNYLEGGDKTVTGLYVGTNTQNINIDGNYVQDCNVVFETGLVKNSSYRYNSYQKYNAFGQTYDTYLVNIFDGVNGNEVYGNFYKDAPAGFRDTRKFDKIEALTSILAKDFSVTKAGGSKVTLNNSLNKVELRADEVGAGANAVIQVDVTDVVRITPLELIALQRMKLENVPSNTNDALTWMLMWNANSMQVERITAAASLSQIGLVKQAAISADGAGNPGVAYDQTEVQNILDELRDLKTKMRSAGLLAT